jgi:thiamine-phosphate pyrophosphorylase
MAAVYPLISPRDLRESRPAVERLLATGISLLQLRGGSARELFEAATVLKPLAGEKGVTLIVNNHVDVAALTGAGVHIGQDDLPVREARKLLGPDAVIGVSTHSIAEAVAAADGPADYIAIGPIYPTGSKSDARSVVGLEGLRAACDALEGRGWFGRSRRTDAAVVAIGGITASRSAKCLEAGANLVAAISAFRIHRHSGGLGAHEGHGHGSIFSPEPESVVASFA